MRSRAAILHDVGGPWSTDSVKLRFELGVEEGDEVSPFYDPMIAKVVASGPTRDEVIDELSSYLNLVEVWPIRTNAPFLWRALDDQDFRQGNITTSFIADHSEALETSNEPDDYLWASAARAKLDPKEGEPEKFLPGFRLNAAPAECVTLKRGAETRTLSREDIDPDSFVFSLRDEESIVVFEDGAFFEFELASRGSIGAAAADGAIVAPMPGKVTSVEVSQGEKVAKGQRLLTLEAMKMEHGLVAPFDGVVAELNAKAGAQVQVDALLARVEASEK